MTLRAKPTAYRPSAPKVPDDPYADTSKGPVWIGDIPTCRECSRVLVGDRIPDGLCKHCNPESFEF